jgi:RNA polymerase sigma-70 factor, ECF subfamily
MTTSAADAAGELQLLERTARGDREAFQRLYFVFHRRLTRFLLRVTRRPDVTEEIINDTMLVVWERAGDFRGESHLSTWIMGIAYRRALKRLSSERRTERASSIDDWSALLDVESMADLAQRAELVDWLDTAFTRLSPEHRLTIQLTYLLGMSCEEIANITECPINTVKTRMFYARQRLRELLVTLATPTADHSPGIAR